MTIPDEDLTSVEDLRTGESKRKPLRFWLVWSPSHGAPQKKHYTRCQADQEANRLAVKHMGDHFFVMEAQGYYSLDVVPKASFKEF